MAEVKLSCLTLGRAYETRRVTLGNNADIKRGEAVEVLTSGAGTALDVVQALGIDESKLEGYALHTYLNGAAETCEADIIYVAPFGLARSLVTYPAGLVSELVNITDRIPLMDSINEQGVI